MAVNLKPAGSGSSQALGDVELQQIDACWRACNYLAAGMIYLQDNPLLHEPLQPACRCRARMRRSSCGYLQIQALAYAHEHGVDRADLRNWTWPHELSPAAN